MGQSGGRRGVGLAGILRRRCPGSGEVPRTARRRRPRSPHRGGPRRGVVDCAAGGPRVGERHRRAGIALARPRRRAPSWCWNSNGCAWSSSRRRRTSGSSWLPCSSESSRPFWTRVNGTTYPIACGSAPTRRGYRSFLEFDPARVVRRTRQPVLIIHGKLDRQIPIAHADRLAEMLEARRRRESTLEVQRLPGIDHRLLDSSAGAIDQYSQLLDRRVSGTVITALADWMDPHSPGPPVVSPPVSAAHGLRHVDPCASNDASHPIALRLLPGAAKTVGRADGPPTSTSTRRWCPGCTVACRRLPPS